MYMDLTLFIVVFSFLFLFLVFKHYLEGAQGSLLDVLRGLYIVVEMLGGMQVVQLNCVFEQDVCCLIPKTPFILQKH